MLLSEAPSNGNLPHVHLHGSPLLRWVVPAFVPCCEETCASRILRKTWKVKTADNTGQTMKTNVGGPVLDLSICPLSSIDILLFFISFGPFIFQTLRAFLLNAHA